MAHRELGGVNMRRKIILLAATVAALDLLSIAQPIAAPAAGGAILGALKATSSIQDARTLCYNKYTGKFLNWGHCKPIKRVRIGCRDKFTKRFLYWGACRH